MTTNENPPPKKRTRHSLRQQTRAMLPRAAFTVAEWAAITATSKAMIYRQMQAGALHYAQLGGTRRIPASELVRLGLADASVNPTT